MDSGDTFPHKCVWAEDCTGEHPEQCSLDNSDGAHAVYYSETSKVVVDSPGPYEEVQQRKKRILELAAAETAAKEKAYMNGRGDKTEHNLYNLEELAKCSGESDPDNADLLSPSAWLDVDKDIHKLRTDISEIKKERGRLVAEIVGILNNKVGFRKIYERFEDEVAAVFNIEPEVIIPLTSEDKSLVTVATTFMKHSIKVFLGMFPKAQDKRKKYIEAKRTLRKYRVLKAKRGEQVKKIQASSDRHPIKHTTASLAELDTRLAAWIKDVFSYSMDTKAQKHMGKLLGALSPMLKDKKSQCTAKKVEAAKAAAFIELRGSKKAPAESHSNPCIKCNEDPSCKPLGQDGQLTAKYKAFMASGNEADFGCAHQASGCSLKGTYPTSSCWLGEPVGAWHGDWASTDKTKGLYKGLYGKWVTRPEYDAKWECTEKDFYFDYGIASKIMDGTSHWEHWERATHKL
jgi:hypothetical protein